MIKPTPRQQKAEFSAFDNSSQFRSGLKDVGNALADIGRSVETFQAKSKKRKVKAQTILADKAEVSRLDEFNKAYAGYKSALASSDNDAISEAYEKVEEIKNRDFTSFLPKDSGGSLEDSEVIAAYDNNFNKSVSQRMAEAALEQAEMIVLNNASDSAQDHVSGETEFGLANFGVGSSIEDFKSHYNAPSFLDGSTSEKTGIDGEPYETLTGVVKTPTINTIVSDIAFTVSEADRKEKVEVFKDLVKRTPHLNWAPKEIQKVLDAVTQSAEQRTAATDGLLQRAEAIIPRAELALSSSMPDRKLVNQYFVDLNDHYEKLSLVLPPDNAKLERIQSTRNLAGLYVEGKDAEGNPGKTLVQMMNEYRLANPGLNTSQAIEEFLVVLETPKATPKNPDPEKQLLYLDSSSLSKLKNSLANTETDVLEAANSGSADYLQYIVPGFRAKMIAASTNPAKRLELEGEYFKYRAENPSVFGKPAPSQFFIPVADKFPDTLDSTTLMERYKRELAQNSLSSLNYYASSKLTNANVTANEAAYYFTVWAGTNTFIQQGLSSDQAQVAFGNSDMFQLLQNAENATAENIDFAEDIIRNDDSALGRAYKSMITVNPAVAESLRLMVVGLSQGSNADSYSGKQDKIEEAERGRILNNIGYIDTSNSSGSVFVPPSIMQQFSDPGQVGLNLLGGDAIRSAWQNKVHPERVSLVYQAAVYAAIAEKYGENLDQASELENIAQMYKPQPADDGSLDVYESYADFLSNDGYMSEDLYFREKTMPFIRAFARGAMNNTMTVEGEEKPRMMLNLPTNELHNGQVEQRIYLTPHTMSGGVTKVGLDNGELVYITLPEVEAYVAEYVKRYTSPLAVTFGYEEDLSYGLGRTNSIIRSMSNIAYQSKPRATRSDERASLQLARENAKIYERNQEIIDQDSQPVELIIGDQQVD
jgi:hypothetical protein